MKKSLSIKSKLSLIGLMILISCSKNAEKKLLETVDKDIQNILPIEIDIVENFNTREILKLSNYSNKIHYVKLETNPNNLMNRVDKLEMTSEHIFISNFQTGLFVFDHKGKYLKKIGRKGKGPGEYTFLRSSIVDRKREKIYIFPNFKREMIVFNYHGNYIRTVKLEDNYYAKFIRLVNDEYILIYLGDIQRKFGENEQILKDYNFLLMDLEGNIIKKYGRPFVRNNDHAKIVVSGLNYQPIDKNILLNEWLHSNILLMKPDLSLDVEYKLLFGDWQSPTDLKIPQPQNNGINELTKIIGGQYFYELTFKRFSDFAFIGFELSNRPHKAVYNFINNELIFCDNVGHDDKTIGLVNDLDGGIPFWPEYIVDSLMIMPINAFEFIDYFDTNRENLKMGESLKLLEGLTINDNPVLVMARMN